MAAALKGHQLATAPVAGDGLLDARWVLVAAVEFELLFGLWLLSGLLPGLTWAAACGCFALFACVSLYKALSGAATCGCFGRVPVNPWYTFALDAAAVLTLLRFRPLLPSPFSLLPSDSSRLRLTAVLALFLLLGLPAGWAMATYRAASLDDTGELLVDGRVVVLEPEKWIGKRFPLLPYIDIGEQLAEGEWIVVLFHDHCPDCRKLLQKLAGNEIRIPAGTRLGLIEMPTHDGATQIRWPACAHGKLDDSARWFARTPSVIALKDGAVAEVWDHSREKG